MKLRSVLCVVFTAFVFVMTASAQQTDGWMRVQTDDGNFSVEVPAEYKYFFDSNGFVISNGGSSFQLKNMSLFTAYKDGSLLSFEVYDSDRSAVDALYDLDGKGTRWRKGVSGKIDQVTARQLEWAGADPVYAVSRFFRIKGKAVVMTAASRNGKTDTIARFFDSATVEPRSDGGTKLSQLTVTEVKIETAVNPPAAPAKVAPRTATKPDPDVKKIVVLRLPRASYVNQARMNSTSGSIRLKPTFGKDGWVEHIVITKDLPDGLVRQTLFSAIRTRFLPEEKNGLPISITRTLEYSFSIY
ncbi:MAG: energy transducer TonB [Acidobacteriota bacterium]